MKKRRGYILLVTLSVMAIVLFIGFAYVDLYISGQRVSILAGNDMVAEAAADAGIDSAIYQLEQNPSWASGFSGATMPHSGAGYSMSFDRSQSAIPYSTTNVMGLVFIFGYGGRIVPPGAVDLICRGSFGGSRRTAEALVQVVPTIRTISRW